MGEKVLPQAPLAGQVNFGISSIDVQNNLAPSVSRHPNRRLGRFGTAALSLVLASCGGNAGGYAPTQTDGGSHPENPGIGLAAGETPGTPELISGLFDEFYTKYSEQHLEEYNNVLSYSLEVAWALYLGIPKEKAEEIFLNYKASEIFTNPKETILEYFELIPNEKGVVPRKGDIIAIKPDDKYFPNGFFAIAQEDEPKIIGQAGVLIQYHGPQFTGTPGLALLPLDITLGLLRPIRISSTENPDTRVADGDAIAGENEDVIASEVQNKISFLFDKFLAENEGVHEDPGPMIRWLDALEIPADSMISGYDFSEGLDVFIKDPTDATRQFFEVIPYREGLEPQKGDFVILSPNESYGNGRIAIALGATTENGMIGVFTGDAQLDRFPLEEISGLIRPKGIDYSDGENTEGEVLGVNTESIHQILERFVEKYKKKGVETSDPDNFRQCVDLIWAWLDELGIPRDSIRNFDPEHPYASQIYTNADDETRKYFDVIQYQEGMRFEIGDIVVWDEQVGSVAGHVAIAIQEGGMYFSQNYPLENDPEKRIANFDEIPNEGILGALRLKDFSSSETAPEQARKIVKSIEFPELDGTPLERAKYAFITQVINSMNVSETDERNLVQWTDYPQDKLIEIAQALARGEEVNLDEPITYYFTSFRDRYGGIAYLNALKVSIERENPLSNADIANGLEWSGNPYFTAIIKVGMKRDNSKDFDFDQITATTPWMDVHTTAYTELRSDSAFVNISGSFQGKAFLGGPGIVDVFWIHDRVLQSGGISD